MSHQEQIPTISREDTNEVSSFRKFIKSKTGKVVVGAAGLSAVAGIGIGVANSQEPSGETVPTANETYTPTPDQNGTETTAPEPSLTDTPETVAPSPNAGETLSPETAEVVNRLETMDYSEFIGSTTPEERAIWCEGEINPDIEDTATTWYGQTKNPLDILPEATTTNTPQEIITLINYQYRQAAIGHYYEPDNGTVFDLNKTQKAMSCLYFDATSEFANTRNNKIVDFYNGGAFGHSAEGVALQGQILMETAIDSKEPYEASNGYWSQDILSQKASNENNMVWENIIRVEYPFNDETHVMYMINTSENTPND